MQIKTKIVSCHTANSKPVKHVANGTVILGPFSIPCLQFQTIYRGGSVIFRDKTHGKIARVNEADDEALNVGSAGL